MYLICDDQLPNKLKTVQHRLQGPVTNTEYIIHTHKLSLGPLTGKGLGRGPREPPLQQPEKSEIGSHDCKTSRL